MQLYHLTHTSGADLDCTEPTSRSSLATRREIASALVLGGESPDTSDSFTVATKAKLDNGHKDSIATFLYAPAGHVGLKRTRSSNIDSHRRERTAGLERLFVDLGLLWKRGIHNV